MGKNIVCFIGGLGLGAGFAYILCKKKFEKEAQEEINIMKQEYEERKFRSTENKPDISEVKVTTEVKEVKEENKELKDATKIINYSGYSKPEKVAETGEKEPQNRKEKEENNEEEEDEEDHDAEDAYVRVHPTEGPLDIQFSISPEQFANENIYFDKITLIYYAGDDILATEDGENINDSIGNTVGGMFRSMFGEFEVDVAYIRNEKAGCDYEVILEHCNFYDTPSED